MVRACRCRGSAPDGAGVGACSKFSPDVGERRAVLAEEIVMGQPIAGRSATVLAAAARFLHPGCHGETRPIATLG